MKFNWLYFIDVCIAAIFVTVFTLGVCFKEWGSWSDFCICLGFEGGLGIALRAGQQHE